MIPMLEVTDQERQDLKVEYQDVVFPHVMTAGGEVWRRVHRDGQVDRRDHARAPWTPHTTTRDVIGYLESLRRLGWRSEN